MTPKVLIVDDAPEVRALLAGLLGSENYELAFAGTGGEGIEMARKLTPDLILLDVMLPDLEGFEVCRRLREIRYLDAVPVVLVTSLSDRESRLKGFEAGADDFITKPFEFEELLFRIEINLNRAARVDSSDPLTGLPGSVAGQEELKRRVVDGSPFAYMLVRIEGLRPYRSVYGSEKVEDVVGYTADIIKEVKGKQGSGDDFASYLGGGTFSIATVPGRAELFSRSIIHLFEEGIGGFFSAGDLARGCFTTFDRRGGMLDNPLLSISIGAATNVNRNVRSHWEAAEIAEEVLDYASGFEGSNYRLDRRKGDKRV